MDALSGDFEQVWAAHRDHLWRVAWLICGDAHVADDVVASAGARAWRGWAPGQVVDPGAYLRRAVVNETTDRFRRSGRDRRWLDRRTGEGRGGDVLEDQAADRVDLARALARLPVGQRAVIVLRFWVDLSEAATADALSISTGTMKSRTSRALTALAQELAGPVVASTEGDTR